MSCRGETKADKEDYPPPSSSRALSDTEPWGCRAVQACDNLAPLAAVLLRWSCLMDQQSEINSANVNIYIYMNVCMYACMCTYVCVYIWGVL